MNSLGDVADRHPWPEQRPDFTSSDWSLDGGGKRLVFDRIPSDRPFVVLEIGAFLGASTRQWLDHSPTVHVVAVDPWQDDPGFSWGDYAATHGRAELGEQLRRPDGPYQTFLATNWEYRDRLTPVRGKSPDVLSELSDAGCVPDLIYFDNDKSGRDIDVAHDLWPNAALTGDDWRWMDQDGVYAVRASVRSFARKHGVKVAADRSTWALTHRLTLRDRAANADAMLRDLLRPIRRFIPAPRF